MNKMKPPILITIFLVIVPMLSWGDVEVLNHPLSSGGVYMVPAGKVLLLETAVSSETGSGTLSIRTPGSTFSFAYSALFSMPTATDDRQRLYLKEGSTITATETGRSFVIFGRLATPEELYARTDPKADIEVSGSSATVVARAESGRPVRFQLEESTDLMSWFKAAVSSVTTTRNSLSAEVEKSADDESKFVRAVAKEIPVNTGG